MARVYKSSAMKAADKKRTMNGNRNVFCNVKKYKILYTIVCKILRLHRLAFICVIQCYNSPKMVLWSDEQFQFIFWATLRAVFQVLQLNLSSIEFWMKKKRKIRSNSAIHTSQSPHNPNTPHAIETLSYKSIHSLRDRIQEERSKVFICFSLALYKLRGTKIYLNHKVEDIILSPKNSNLEDHLSTITLHQKTAKKQQPNRLLKVVFVRKCEFNHQLIGSFQRTGWTTIFFKMLHERAILAGLITINETCVECIMRMANDCLHNVNSVRNVSIDNWGFALQNKQRKHSFNDSQFNFLKFIMKFFEDSYCQYYYYD
ncbi:hypothetical protein Bhyg_15360 [Pseudolycoriella hygida]|uniref:Uncharacterized protein n=1 Tax=Pseudolycoriella hygida TaxID=35572 RepID=A0A9Q0MTE4_9DIPT|nr:hypothetical protein Bhyg_15360 [Pseudolycoriella hygida]